MNNLTAINPRLRPTQIASLDGIFSGTSPHGGKFYTIFPYFHLAGFLSLVINPIFLGMSSPVIVPALMPPSAALRKEVTKQQKLGTLYFPPSEPVLNEPGGLDLSRDLDFLSYAKGSFSQKARGALVQITELIPLYCSTEASQTLRLAPRDPQKDYAYMEWTSVFKMGTQASDDLPGAFN